MAIYFDPTSTTLGHRSSCGICLVLFVNSLPRRLLASKFSSVESLSAMSTLRQPMAFPTEIFSDIIKITMLRHPKRVPISIMLTNHQFLDIVRPLFYRSTALPNAETASVFFTTLRRCEEDDSNYGPRAKLIIHLRLAYEPGAHRKRYGHLITRMSSLKSITTDFRDNCRQYSITNLALLLRRPPASLQTIRFISINVDKTKVGLACLSLAVILISSIGRRPSHRVRTTDRSGSQNTVLIPFGA
jgi:hypothetical protein